jgi:hypothetical protein
MATQIWKNLVSDYNARRWKGVVENYEQLKAHYFNLGSLPQVKVDGVILDQAASNGAAFAAAQDLAIRAKRQLQLAI